MSSLLVLISILKTFGVSLGVGASTITITHFFVAIADGTIDETERRMLGAAYVILRVAMVIILVATLLLLFYEYKTVGLSDLPAYAFGELLALFVLYLNALLMTAHLVPTAFGPALQAGSWYTLGMLVALQAEGVTDFSFVQFLFGYSAGLVFAIGMVNAIMAILKAKRNPS